MAFSLPAGVIKTFRDIQLNFEVLAKSMLTFADRGPHTFSMGTATLAFSANNDATVTVTHGLKGTPSNVHATPRLAGSSSVAAVACDVRDSTSIRLNARTFNGANITANIDVDWLAVL